MVNPSIESEKRGDYKRLVWNFESKELYETFKIVPHHKYRELNSQFQWVLKQLDFNVDDIEDYEVLHYQLGKVFKLWEFILNKRESFLKNNHDNLMEKWFVERRVFTKHYVYCLHKLAKDKHKELKDFYSIVFGYKFDDIEDKLIKANEKYKKLNPKNELERTIQKAEQRIQNIY